MCCSGTHCEAGCLLTFSAETERKSCSISTGMGGGALTYPIIGAQGRIVSLATAGSCTNIPELDCQSLSVPAHLCGC